MFNLSSGLGQILNYFKMAIPSSEHNWSPICITLGIQKPFNICSWISRVHRIPVKTGLFIIFNYFLYSIKISVLAGIEKQALLDLLALFKF